MILFSGPLLRHFSSNVPTLPNHSDGTKVLKVRGILYGLDVIFVLHCSTGE